MLDLLKSLFKPRDLHKEGFEFAQKHIAENGIGAVESMRALVETARDFKTWNEFDQGIERAIELFEEAHHGKNS